MAQGWKKDYSRYRGFFLNILNAYNTKPNVRVYLELMLSLGTIILFSIFAIKPTILTIIEINNEIKTKEEMLSKLEKKVSDFKIVTSLLQKEKDNLKLVDEAVPSTAELEKVIVQIEAIATSSNVTVSSISSSELILKGTLERKKVEEDFKPLPEGATELPITIAVKGDYVNLLNFTKSLEDLRRPMRIDTYIINKSKAVDETSVLTLTITGRLPYIINNIEKKENEK